MALASPAFAQETPEAEEDSTPQAARVAVPEKVDDDFHDRRFDETGVIVVTAAGLSQLDVLAGTSVMEGVELQRNLSGQMGEVLAKLPGVSATSFSPGASRPVLRGFSGERVRVLVDGIGAIDVSNTSADHAVTIDPLTAERVEVLRGPAVMLYGSQAIGGAVNVIDKRIPRRMPREDLHFDGLVAVDTVSDLREVGASADLPVGPHLAFHIDGSWRETGDLSVPGFVVAPSLREEILAEADADEASAPEEAAELREAALARDILPNSATRTWSGNAGFAIFAGESNLGAAVGVYDTRYGVPGRPGAGHAHDEDGGIEDEEEEEAPVSIDLRQWRADLRAELALGEGFFSQLRSRVGFSDYTHTEFEGDEVGTVFDVSGIEGRLELVQSRRGNWQGSVGGQFYSRDFAAAGAEAYVPPNRTAQYSLFALQEFDLGPLQAEIAGRFETNDIEAHTLGIERNFENFSGALGLAHETEAGMRFGVNVNRVGRAPSAEELFSDGPHIATQAFEVGDPDLLNERAWGAEAYARGTLGAAEVSLTLFKSWFDNYIFLADTGLEEDGLPVREYRQADADYFGVEGEISVPLIAEGPVRLNADLRGEYVRATLADGTPLPRIPPLSLLGALEAKSGPFDLRTELQWFARQDRVAPLETPTDSFALVNASLAWKPLRGDDTLTVLLQADNIFDAEGRRHASFTKDFVPLPGRNLKLSVRASF